MVFFAPSNHLFPPRISEQQASAAASTSAEKKKALEWKPTWERVTRQGFDDFFGRCSLNPTRTRQEQPPKESSSSTGAAPKRKRVAMELDEQEPMEEEPKDWLAAALTPCESEATGQATCHVCVKRE